MEHTIILSISLIIFSWIVIQLYRKHRELPLWYFRNFFVLWSLYTVAHGFAEIFYFKNLYMRSMILVYAIPFFYIAGAFLAQLPFVMYKKKGFFQYILASTIVSMGLVFSATIFFKTNDMLGMLGLFNPFFNHLAYYIVSYRVWSAVSIFAGVSIFFFHESWKSREFISRLRALLIGVAFMIGAISEWFHVQDRHVAGAELYILGFLLASAGILYTFWGVGDTIIPLAGVTSEKSDNDIL